MTDDDDPDDDELPPLPMHPELLAALVADPDDEAAWMVFEDWILGQGGDPRVLVIERERAQWPTGMAGREVAKRLLGPRNVRARTTGVSRAGMLRTATFVAYDGPAAVAAFVAVPGARLLTGLRLHTSKFESLAALAPLAPTLEALAITGRGDFDTPLLAPLERLTKLEVGQVDHLVGHAGVLARLTDITLRVAGAIELGEVARTPLAAAVRVELGGTALATPGLRRALPAVRALTVHVDSVEAAADTATALVDAGLVAQLASVAIEAPGDRASVGADVRARFRAGAFAHVADLVLPRALLTRERDAMRRR